MTDEKLKPKNGNTNAKQFTFIVIILVVVLIIIASILIVFNTQKKSDDSSKNSSSSSSSSSSYSVSQSQLAASTKLSGKYIGSVTILTDFLIFPKAEFNILADNTFILNASGLDLALLNNPKLAVGEKYPVAQVVATGITKQPEIGKIEISIENIKVDFLVDNVAVETTQSQAILTALGSYGIIIPTASKESPVVGKAAFVQDGNRVIITNSSDSSIKIKMDGVKS